MTGITVAAGDLAAVTGITLTEDQSAALDRLVRTAIQSAYVGSLDTVEGRRADVLNGVYQSVASRVMTNPTGARSIGLGSANVTLGGSDEAVSNVLSLTAAERADLLSLRRPSRLSYIRLRGF